LGVRLGRLFKTLRRLFWNLERTPRGLRHVDELRERVAWANERVAQAEWLLAGWRDLADQRSTRAEDAALANDLLKTFQADLKAAIGDKEEAERELSKRLRDLFLGAKGRRPETDQELDEWLASPEGKAATSFEPTPLPPSEENRRRS